MTETTARQAVDFFLRGSGSRQTLILNFDGDRAAHDHARKFRNGRGSYRTLVQRLRDTQLFKLHPTVNARATITKETRHCSRTQEEDKFEARNPKFEIRNKFKGPKL
jgi:sulfatase maturation enzyme AslB (radical SAM superfamily)